MSFPNAKKILIISHQFDPHVDQMVVLIESLGLECVRWITGGFPLNSTVSLSATQAGFKGELKTARGHFDLTDIRSVWYRHPGPPTVPQGLTADERRFTDAEARSTLTGVFQVFDWFWVNHPDKVRIASSKMLQLKVAAELGFSIPKTCITNDADTARSFLNACGGSMVYKPFNSSLFTSDGKVCYTTPILASDLDHIDLIKKTPGIFQENVEKCIELRITVIGRNVFATEIHSQELDKAKQDWREANPDELRHIPHELPETVEQSCLKLLARFGLVYGAIDMILTPEGEYVFLENNPSGQFGWIEGITGKPLTATLARLLIAGEVI